MICDVVFDNGQLLPPMKWPVAGSSTHSLISPLISANTYNLSCSGSGGPKKNWRGPTSALPRRYAADFPFTFCACTALRNS